MFSLNPLSRQIAVNHQRQMSKLAVVLACGYILQGNHAAAFGWVDWVGTQGSWFDPDNWSSAALPGDTDAVRIERSSDDILVRLSQPDTDVAVSEVLLDGATLIIENGGSLSAGDFGNGFSPSRSTIIVDGPASVLKSDQRGVGLRNASLTLQNGGVLNVSEAWLNFLRAENNTEVNIGDGGLPGVINADHVFLSNATLNFNHNQDQYYFTSDGTAGGTGLPITGSHVTLRHTGPGTTILTAASSFSIGEVLLSDGTLQIDADNRLGQAGVDLIFSGGTLGISDSFTTARNTLLSADGGAISVHGGEVFTHAGILSGPGGLIKTGSGALSLTGANTYTGGTTLEAGSLHIDADSSLGAAGGLIFNGGTLAAGSSFATARATTLSADGTFAIAAGETLIHSGPIDGNGSLIKTGTGTLTLTGANSYSGATRIDAGTVAAADSAALGAGSNRIVFDGGSLQLPGGWSRLGRRIQLDDGGGSIETASPGSPLLLNSDISGSGALYLRGQRDIELTGSNIYSGGTWVDGIQVRGSSGALQGDFTLLGDSRMVFAQSSDGSYGGSISGGGAVVKDGSGTLTLTGTHTYSGGTTLNEGALAGDSGSLRGDFSLAANTRLIVDQAADGIFAGTLNGAGALVKDGAGTLILTGTQNHSGGISINGGTLQIDADANLGAAGGDLIFNGGTLRAAATLTTQRSASLASDAGIDVDSAATLFFDGSIDGAGALIKRGGGQLVLSAANTYSGGTRIEAGGLVGTTESLRGDIVNLGRLTFDQDRDGSFGGAVSGSGELIKTGAGTLTLTGGNTYSGGTRVEAGVLVGNVAALPGDIVNAAQVVFDQGGDATYTGSISGSGAVVKDGSGTLTLTRANSYRGGTTVVAGTLAGDSQSLQGAIDNSARLVFEQGADGHLNGTLGGDGTFIKRGQGQLTLGGDNPFSGDAFIEQGSLAVDGDFSARVHVGSGTRLEGRGSIGTARVGGGTVAPGNSSAGQLTIGQLSVDGDLSFSNGGRLQIEAAPSGAADQLRVTGTASLDGGSVDIVAAPGTYDPGQRYTFLIADGGISGSFETVTSSMAFLDPQLRYAGNQVTLSLRRNSVDFAAVAQTPNQLAVGSTLDSFGGSTALSPVIEQIVPLSAAAARRTFDDLSGVQHTHIPTFAASLASQFQDQLFNRLSQWPAAADRDRSLWGQLVNGSGDIDHSRQARGADYRYAGVTLGADIALSDSWRLGGAANYGRTDADPSGGSATMDSWQLAGYGRWQGQNLFVNSALGWGRHGADLSRRIPAIAAAARADADSHGVSAALEAGSGFAIGDALGISPYIGVDYLRLERERFSERGAGAAGLSVRGDTRDLWRSELGLRMTYQRLWDNLRLRPVLNLAWIREHGDDQADITAAFSAEPDTRFVIAGPRLDRDRLLLGLGLNIDFSDSGHLYLHYQGQEAGNHADHQLALGFRVRW